MAEDEECLEKDPVLILDKMQEYGHLSQTYALHLKKNVQGIQSLLSECQKNEEILSSKTKLLKEEKNKLVKEISQLTQDLPSSAKKEIQRLRLELVKQGKALEEHSEKQLEIFQIIESLQVEKSDLLNKLLMNEEEVDNDEEEDKTPKFLSFRQLEKLAWF
ncbi:GRIP and coiled-coil domain-containing protein 2-like [Limulus polyphemus]|uniref:GRIP and coiled-coil domain-containing protein 2-like n=1 Tax=Limulus polyphemus TaxID=6850 RepID=A0ABM1SPH8_LIMPO|nr:GRIP and coiled-coil domain-containing protein 2-like [Limulus polyphemus]XP_022245535.1 GRIP and coiled-coil domain-containing protein 2-like [Limulus polyphemus]